MDTGRIEIEKAVILARGLGMRMRASHGAARLANDQLQAANDGIKAMIPVGRPFLDFILSALADAGFHQICLVIGPEHASIREYYQSLAPRRIEITFAIQERALGTANALLAAQGFSAGDEFLTLNSDNYYPCDALHALRNLGEPGLSAFERESLLRESNISRERVRNFALLQINAGGYLETIVEKPFDVSSPSENSAPAKAAPPQSEVFVSMNCWRFDSAIFRACEMVPLSTRGEFELSEAVQYGLSFLGLRFKALPSHSGVLDLSTRFDIAPVAQRLAGIRVEL